MGPAETGTRITRHFAQYRLQQGRSERLCGRAFITHLPFKGVLQQGIESRNLRPYVLAATTRFRLVLWGWFWQQGRGIGFFRG